jgi:hypothetical protein
LYGAETWTLRKVNQKYLESFEMCWRRMEKISWTDRVRNEVLRSVKEEWSILHIMKRREARWIGHVLSRNCFLEHVTEGKMKGRRGRRRKQLFEGNERILEVETGSIISHLMENSLWKRLWTCR